MPIIRLIPILILLAANAAVAQNQPALNYDGQTYSGDKLPGAIRQKLYELDAEYYTRRQQAFDEYVLNRYLRERAASENQPVQAIQQELLAVQQPGEAVLRQFYEANRGRIQGSFEQVRERLAEYLANQAMGRRQAELLEQIRSEKKYSVSMTEPTPPRFEIGTQGHPAKGAADAEVVLVEFADYQCPHCKNAVETVRQLLSRFDGKLRVVYKDFPINPSGISRQVAIGAYCAGRQDRFWDFHGLAFERQDYLKVVTPAMLASELDLDADAFKACTEAPEAAAHVAASETEAESLGITGTPAFFVNGRRVQIQSDTEADLAEAIERALAEKS